MPLCTPQALRGALVNWSHPQTNTRCPLSTLVLSPETTSTRIKKTRRPRRSSTAVANLAPEQLQTGMWSKQALERALDQLTPRVREAFELLTLENLDLGEICEKMVLRRPTVGNYILRAFNQVQGFDAKAALFHAIGRDRLKDFVRHADPYRCWYRANGYNSFATNSVNVAILCRSARARNKLVTNVRRGVVAAGDIEKEKHRISDADVEEVDITEIHLAASVGAKRHGLSRQQRIFVRKVVHRGLRSGLLSLSDFEQVDSQALQWAAENAKAIVPPAEPVLREWVEKLPEISGVGEEYGADGRSSESDSDK
ncbi:hypothetical protein C8R46DRAFT_1349281 [Mycena filopes]|nr:hypothetical protein C8R46DRAFT_1349281 [Mycena filopes]